jgi:uncharacterized repeat protein (TIGR01451 family)
MPRHSVRWLALVVVSGLIVVLVSGLSKAMLPGPNTTMPHGGQGPSALTDTDGRFRFEGLHSASHILRLDPRTLPAGPAPDAANLTMTLSPGVTRALAVAPGLALRATYHSDGTLLDGVLFHDRDGNGLQGAGENGLAGARLIDPDVYQYFVPFNDDALSQSFSDVLVPVGCLPGGPPDIPSTTLDSTISLTGSSNGTTIYYDQWEDGYDADPTVPGPTTLTLTVNAGGVQTWRNNIPIPRAPANLLYDGRDRITIIGQPASMVRAAWPATPGTLLGGAWEMSKVSDWGQHYTIPIGEDLGYGVGTMPYSDFDYVSASVMAAYDGTVVQIDANADGIFESSVALNAGETTFIRGSVAPGPAAIAIHSGAQISATLPVQVQVRAGNCRAPYSGRSYTLVPVEKWANDYWSPISSFLFTPGICTVGYNPPQPNTSADVDIYIVNPNAAPLAVNYENAGGTGTLTVPARSTASYLKLLTQQAALVRSNTQGVHLFANDRFWAVTAVDTTSLGNNGADFDWSYSLIPADRLSARVVLSWAPGNANNPPTAFPNGSTVYVQAIANGTIVRADLDGDGVFDNFDINGDGDALDANAYGYNETTSAAGVTLNRGQTLRISDPIDHDMTRASISAQDNLHRLAVVYGEDACRAQRALPFLDLGYTVLPLPVPEFSKSAKLVVDADNSGDVSPGDTIEYRVLAYNNDTTPIINPIIIDTLPYTYSSFLIGSIVSIPAPNAPGVTYDNGPGTFTYVPTGPPGTPDPNIHAFKGLYPNLPPGGSISITFRAQLNRQIPPNVTSVTNYSSLSSANTPPSSSEVTTPINQVDLQVHKTDGVTVANPPQRLTYTLTYTNAGPGIAHNAVMTDTLPPTAYDVVTLPQPGVITPTIQPGRVIFQLGTLLPNQTGTTTVSLTLQNTAQDPVVNTVVIGSRSFDHNPNNNTSIDIDRVLPADVQISKNDGLTVVERGNQLTYTLIYTNAGPGVAYNVVMTDTLPPTAINVSTPSVPGVITPTLQPGRIIFQLGTLQAGQNGRTTVTLTLGPSTPGGVNIVNSVEISTTSKDPNPGNNRSTDIDRTRGTTAVVLSEFRVERQAGGVLLAWRTVAEQDNYGFRIYRSRTPSRASAVLLTAQIIPGQGRGRADGAAYSFVDSGAPAGSVYYWLEDIDLNGVSTFHGPAQPFLQSVRTRIWLPLVGR